jgi:hypothetical protein
MSPDMTTHATGRLLATRAIGGFIRTALSSAGSPRISLPCDQKQSRSRQDHTMADFSIRMTNKLQFSSCDAPHQPTSEAYEERLAVELRGDLLTITELGKQCVARNRIYAQRTLDLPGTSTFVVLPELPSRVRDGSFFPALGTVAVFDAEDGTKRRLRAVGIDFNSGHCRGWIFDAVEM